MRTIVLLLENRNILERIENQIFENEAELIIALKRYGISEEEKDSLGVYGISDFMDLVNDQILDNLTDTFIGYVKLRKKRPQLDYSNEQIKLQTILQDYGCEEFGDSILDAICDLFGHPMTPLGQDEIDYQTNN